MVDIEGRLSVAGVLAAGRRWTADSRIMLNHGQFLGFVKPDGSFRVSGVSNGSYSVQVENRELLFEQVRVDVSSKGNIRARQLSTLKPNAVELVPYPLQITALGIPRYVRPRAQYQWATLFSNPTFWMLAVPCLLILLVRSFGSLDEDMRREMEKGSAELPDVGEMVATLLGRPPTAKSKKNAGNKPIPVKAQKGR
ncbi:unnamed protein product, partial [Mesorhabditis spiculigera]